MFEQWPMPAPPWPHQVRGAHAIVERELPDGVLLPYKVGFGKTFTTIAAAYELYRRKEIAAVVVVCPSYARSVWVDPDPILGEFAKWPAVPIELHEFCAATPKLPGKSDKLQVVVTNYELIRRANHLERLVLWLRQRPTLVVFDESWNLYDSKAAQTKACTTIAHFAKRAVELNGTPGKHEHLYGQISVMDPSAYPVKNIFHWQHRYVSEMGGYGGRKIKAYHEDREAELVRIETRFVVPLLETDVISLPEWMPPTTLVAELTPKTWDLYRQMRDDFIAYLDDTTRAVASQAGARFMRLQQMLAGFVGGVEADDENDQDQPPNTVREVGDEKQRVLLSWLDSNESHKGIIWGRFRPEMQRLFITLRQRGERVFLLWGKAPGVTQRQHDDERRLLKTVFAPGSPDRDRAWIVGHPAAGGAGLNFSGADLAVYASNAQSLRVRTQANGRIHRPGQLQRPRLVDIVAVGPKGQKTVDHSVIATLRADQDMTEWTAAQWRAAVAVE